jgi:hypothetical protein
VVRRALLGAFLLIAACGSDDDAAPPASTVAAADADFCDAFGAVIAGPLTDEGTDVRDPQVLAAAVDVTRAILLSLVGGAPDELRPAAEELRSEYEAGFSVWERYGYDLARVEAEATPEEQAGLDAFLAPPQGPGEVDPLTTLEDGYFDRCTGDVTLPPDLLTTTTSPSP